MGEHSKIEWTDASWTPIRARWIAPTDDGGGKERVGWHCEHVSEGCRNCYAESINNRLGTGLDFKPGNLFRDERQGYHNGEAKLFLDEAMLLAPLRWRRPRQIFVCSMTDLFAAFVPVEWIDRIVAVMALAAWHKFQVLTKRSPRMREYFSDPDLTNRISATLGNMLDGDWIWNEGKQHRNEIERLIDVFLGESTDDEGDVVYHDDPMPLPNVWLGVSAEDQTRADERVPDLLATPAAVRFVSAEPLLGPIDFMAIDLAHVEKREREPSGLVRVDALEGLHVDGEGVVEGVLGDPDPALDWIIVGGESGPKARPMHPAWARSIRDQCAAAGVPFFFKQWGEHAPFTGAEPSTPVSGHLWVYKASGTTIDHEEVERRDMVIGGASAHLMVRLGQKAAGRLLDGVEHNGVPA